MRKPKPATKSQLQRRRNSLARKMGRMASKEFNRAINQEQHAAAVLRRIAERVDAA